MATITTTVSVFIFLFVFGMLVSARSQQRVTSDSVSSLNLQPTSAVTSCASACIIDAFVKTESQVRAAMNQYTFKRDVVLQTIGRKGEITGEYIRNSEFLFDDKGNRIERVTFHPPSTIREMRITREDIQDLAGAQLLGIEIAERNKYRLSYVGEDTLDGRRVHMLTVEPAVIPDPHCMSNRYFNGQLWIDAGNLQVLKVRGVVEPRGKQRFPIFETWREPLTTTLNVPTRTVADDLLHFPNRDVNYRIRVRYYDYKLFASKLTVKDLDEPANQ